MKAAFEVFLLLPLIEGRDKRDRKSSHASYIHVQFRGTQFLCWKNQDDRSEN